MAPYAWEALSSALAALVTAAVSHWLFGQSWRAAIVWAVAFNIGWFCGWVKGWREGLRATVKDLARSYRAWSASDVR